MQTDATSPFSVQIRDACPGPWQVTDGDPWIRCRPDGDGALPRLQGWKLHVSAAVSTAKDVLSQALPVLLNEGAPFKVAASPLRLSELNQGTHGLSQVGKFITVYPLNDDQALRLAAALHEATRGLRGPRVPSDQPLAPQSLVHYRYGGFGQQFLQTPVGAVLPALASPDGALEPDHRRASFEPPSWVQDPFLAKGVCVLPPQEGPLLFGRYLITSTLHRSPRGTICLAVDVTVPRTCIVKTAARDAMLSIDGTDARDRLRREAQVLASLHADPRFPVLYELLEDSTSGDVLLAMEDIEGQTLDSFVNGRFAQGLPLSGPEIVRWGVELAAAVATLDGRGQLFRDLKASNVIVDKDGALRFIDLELVHDHLGAAPALGLGTRGYMSPQQAAGAKPAAADDSYALGALLYYLATGADPSQAPDPFGLLARPIELLNPASDAALIELIGRCLAQEPTARPSAAVIHASLRDLGDKTARAAPAFGLLPSVPDIASLSRKQARRLGDSLCKSALHAANGAYWRSLHRDAGGQEAPRALGSGSAGTLLCLAELYDEFRDPQHGAVLAEGARWLAVTKAPISPPHPGLYVGEAGVGTALLRAGQVLGDCALIEVALQKGQEIAGISHLSPDLYNGTAGRLRFHLWLYEETGDRAQLAHAVTAAERILEGAQAAGDGELRWPIPPGFDSMSGAALPGYAHGAAGIADVLLDLYEVSGDERLLEAAKGAGRWLARLAVPADADAVDWPYQEDGSLGWTYWCHGATGVGRFFLRAAELNAVDGALAMATRAARTVARRVRGTNPTQCHGLSGNIELLLDVYQATGDDAFSNEARSLGALLHAFAVEGDQGLQYSSESPTVFTPDYMLGYGGVALCLLRLADPARPHQLSRRGLRFRRGTS